MPYRSVFLAAFAASTSLVLGAGCACERPLFPRINCLFGCRPAYGAPLAPPIATPAFAPPVGPAFAPPVTYAPQFGQPGCVGCDTPPTTGHYAGLPTTAELPPGAIPVGPPVNYPVGGSGATPMPGPMMSDPSATLPYRPGNYAMTGTGAPTGAPTLLPPPIATPLR